MLPVSNRLNMMEHPFHAYTREILAFRWSDADAEELAPPDPEDNERAARRALSALDKSGRQNLLLLGLGTGDLASRLAAGLPPGRRLIVAELDPEAVRVLLARGRLPWWRPDSRAQVLADGSPWAVVHLLTLCGVIPGQAMAMLNPELRAQPDKRRDRQLRVIQRYASMAMLREYPLSDPDRGMSPVSLSLACILDPEEPRLEEFFAQVPVWLREIVVVWDAETVPGGLGLPADRPGPPLRQLARPLAFDFSAQRNAMLETCRSEWILYLDADERLSPEDWRALPTLVEQVARNGFAPLEGFYFPRRTLDPDPEHLRAGFGLWPDLQLRLFRNKPGLRFVNPIHEQLQGLDGPLALLVEPSIKHLSNLYKTRQEIEEKLRRFDQAAGRPRHRLNRDYPRLPLDFFDELPQGRAPRERFRLLTLPVKPRRAGGTSEDA